MKKIAILAVAMIFLTACKKNETPEALDPELTEAVTEYVAAEDSQEALIKEAQSKPLTSLALSENHYDFKDLKKGEIVEHVYEVTNTGDNPLIISQVKPGCGCTAPEYTSEPILPGQKGKITLKFDSSNFEGMQHKQAEVYANVEKAPIVLSFTANVIKQ